MKIGNVLKTARINSKMTVKEISSILTNQGYKASEKTIYGWESGHNRPNVETLLKLCDIYGIKNTLKTFGYNGCEEDEGAKLSMKEMDIVEKYRFITKNSPDGASVVDSVLDREYSIANQMREQKAHIAELEKSLSPK